MVLNALNCNDLTPLDLKGVNVFVMLHSASLWICIMWCLCNLHNI